MAFLSTDPIDPAAVLAEVGSPARGGTACFVGTVRDHDDGRAVLRLEYSAYAPMAEAECSRILAEAAARWDAAIGLRHRIGSLEVGDAAIVVAAASAHREAAFEACRFVVEQVKHRVPIWKREHYADGAAEWVDPTRVAPFTGAVRG